MPDEVGTEATRSDAPSVDESLFAEAADDTADDTADAVAAEEDSKGGTAEEPQVSDNAEDDGAPPEDLKVVVSIKGGRATIGVQQPRPTRTSRPSMTGTWPG